MARTESMSFQVHPHDEQAQINLMQKFHWNLQSTQEIRTVDSHLERRGDTIYSVTNSERYVKLAFTRDLGIPNLKEIKELEQRFFSLPHPEFPRVFPGGILILCWYPLWPFYYFKSYRPKKQAAEELVANNNRTRSEILNELQKFD